jgi:hypothetical protein
VKKKENRRAKSKKSQEKPNGARRWGLQTMQTLKISVSGTSTMSLDSSNLGPAYLKWLIEDVSMVRLLAQGLQSLHLSKNQRQVSQSAPCASANPPNYGKSVWTVDKLTVDPS